LDPFYIFNILATYCFAYSLRIFAIVFFIIFVRYMTIGKGTSSSVIRGYAPNTNKIGTRLSGLIVLLRALNIICRVIFLLIPGNSTIIIW
jgi:hypothetical protein